MNVGWHLVCAAYADSAVNLKRRVAYLSVVRGCHAADIQAAGRTELPLCMSSVLAPFSVVGLPRSACWHAHVLCNGTEQDTKGLKPLQTTPAAYAHS